MICTNCRTEVPPSFEHAISQNICPKCGREIMPSEKLVVFRTLKEELLKLELSLDKNETIERIVMYLIDHYNILPISKKTPKDVRNLKDPAEETVHRSDKEDSGFAELRKQIYEQVKREKEELEEIEKLEDDDGENVDWEEAGSDIAERIKKRNKAQEFIDRASPKNAGVVRRSE